MIYIMLLVGESGVGKTTVANKLAEYEDYHLVKSFTNRPQRSMDDDDHIYLTNKELEGALLDNDVSPVATTNYGGYIYFTMEEQFLEDRINLYVVDELGVCDTLNYFKGNPNVVCWIIKIRSNRECDRKWRDYSFLSDDHYTQIVDNDGDIDVVVGRIVCRYAI